MGGKTKLSIMKKKKRKPFTPKKETPGHIGGGGKIKTGRGEKRGRPPLPSSKEKKCVFFFMLKGGVGGGRLKD